MELAKGLKRYNSCADQFANNMDHIVTTKLCWNSPKGSRATWGLGVVENDRVSKTTSMFPKIGENPKSSIKQ